jgi:hypothetical protein
MQVRHIRVPGVTLRILQTNTICLKRQEYKKE